MLTTAGSFASASLHPVQREATTANEIEQLSMPFLKEFGNDLSRNTDIKRVLRLKEVRHKTGLGRSTIYRWMDEGKFPKPVRLGARSVAWIEHEIDEWLMSRSK